MSESNPLAEFMGSEAEARETEGRTDFDPLLTPAAFAAAAQHPEIARELGSYIDQQRRFVKIQTEHLHEQRAVMVQNLRLRTHSERIRLVIQLVILAVVASFVALVAQLVISAVNAQDVIVDPFDVPPALATSGLTGEVAAASLLDELTAIQNGTRAIGGKRRVEAAWSGEIRVEIPSTGIAIGEISKLLRKWLGNDTHIGGEIVSLPGGRMSLTVRGTDIPARSFTGPDTHLEDLSREAAEYLYAATAPDLFAEYLFQQQRYGELIGFLDAHYWSAPKQHRAEMLELWGESLALQGQLDPALEKLRFALTQNPYDWDLWEDITHITLLAKGVKAGLAAAAAMHAQAKSAPPDKQPNPISFAYELIWHADYIGAANAMANDEATPIGGVWGTPIQSNIAWLQALLHDWDAAENWLLSDLPSDPEREPIGHLIAGMRALEQGNPADAVGHFRAYAKAWHAIADLQYWLPNAPCYLAVALAGQGQADAARAALAEGDQAPGSAVWGCATARGRVEEALGNRAAADAAFQKAIDLFQSLPQAFNARGRARLARGDYAGAIADFAAAHERGPKWADPLKYWGDALMAQGKRDDAMEKYRAALPLAPGWAELRAALQRAKGK